MRQISVILIGSVVLGLLLTTMSAVDARYHHGQLSEKPNIPHLLQKVYSEVGRDRFRNIWKEFNSRNSDQQDDFLMSDLSDEELTQLGTDFEHLSTILTQDSQLVDLYADFEHNLNIDAFNAMDQRLSDNHTWWGRIKKFLYRKMEKLADEMNMYRKEQHQISQQSNGAFL